MKEFALNKALEHFKINVEEFMEVYNKFNYKAFSIEEFLFTDYDFIAHSTPDRLVKYINDNALDIDTSVLKKCIVDRNREMEISDRLCEIMYNYERGEEEYVKETELLCAESDSLYDSISNVMPKEVFKIRETIKQLTL
jgi:hypothetical protein